MTKIFKALPCLLLSLAAAGQQPAIFEGYVIDSVDRTAITRAVVQVLKLNRKCLSNDSGYFRFDSMPEKVLLRISGVGYHSVEAELFTAGLHHIELCPEHTHLHGVVIAGHREKPELFTTLPSVMVDEEEMKRKRSQTIADAYKNVPGVAVLSTGAGVGKPVIRGLSGQRVATVVNGVRLEGQQWGDEHGTEVDPFGVAAVQVIKGAASVQYGPAAIGGVVKLQAPKFLTEMGHKSQVLFQGWSNNRQGAVAAAWEQRKNSRLAYRLQAGARKAGDSRSPAYNLSNTGFAQQFATAAAEYDRGRWHTEWNYNFYAAHIAILRASHTGNATDLLRAIAADTPLVVAPFTYTIARPYQRVMHHLAAAKLRWERGRSNSLEFSYSFQASNRSEYDLEKTYNPGLKQRPTVALRLFTNQAGVLWQHKPARHVHGAAGVQLTQQLNQAGGLAYLIPSFQSVSGGIFWVEKWEKGRWQAEAGGRCDVQHLRVWSNFNTNAFAQTRTFAGGSWVVAGACRLSAKTNLTAAMGQGWRPPAPNELYSRGLHGGTASFEQGDSTLLPEISHHAHLSLTHRGKRWQWQAHGFVNRMKGYVYLMPQPTPTLTVRGAFVTMHYTQTNALLAGSEGQLSYRAAKHWQVLAAYSLLRGTDFTTTQPLFRMPPNRMQIAVLWQGKDHRRIMQPQAELNAHLVTRQHRTQPGTDYAAPPAAYWLLQLHVGADLIACKRKISCHLSINNLTNRRYRDYLSRYRYFANEPGTDVLLRVAVSF